MSNHASPPRPCKRTKGEVERDIQQIGFRSLTICRPSIIAGERSETRIARGCRLGYLASVSTHFAEKVSCQSASCHCGILARFSSHSETRLPVGFCRGAELKTHDSAERKSRFEPGTPIRSRGVPPDGTAVGKSDILNYLKEHSIVLSCFS